MPPKSSSTEADVLRNRQKGLYLEKRRAIEARDSEQQILDGVVNEAQRVHETIEDLRAQMISASEELDAKSRGITRLLDEIEHIRENKETLVRERVRSHIEATLDAELARASHEEPLLFDAKKMNAQRDSREVIVHDGVSGANLALRVLVQRSATFSELQHQILEMLGLTDADEAGGTLILTDGGGVMWPGQAYVLASTTHMAGVPEIWITVRSKLPLSKLSTSLPPQARYLTPMQPKQSQHPEAARGKKKRQMAQANVGGAAEGLQRADAVLGSKQAMLRDFTNFMVLVILYSILLVNRRRISSAYVLNHAIRSQLAFPFGQHGTSEFSGVSTESDIWSWLRGPLPSFVYTIRYAPIDATRPRPPDILHNLFLLGPVRLLQNRVRRDACTISTGVKGIVNVTGSSACYPAYSASAASTENMQPGEIISPGFAYKQGSMASRMWGVAANYDDDGFPLDIDPRTTNSSAWMQAIAELQNAGWIDLQTRAVIANMNVFDPTTSVMSVVKVTFELTPAGNVISGLRTQQLRLSVYDTFSEKVEGVGEMAMSLCMLYTMYIAYKYFQIEFEQYRLAPRCEQCTGGVLIFFRNIWIFLDATAVVMFVASVLLRLSFFLDPTRRNLSFRATTYSELHALAFRSGSVYQIEALGFIALLAKSFKYFQLQRYLQTVTSALRLGAPMLSSLLLLLSMFLCGFGVLAYQLYGAEINSYSEFIKTINSLISMTRGRMNYEELSDAQPVFNPMFVTVFTLWVTFILINMFFAIVFVSFVESKRAPPSGEHMTFVDVVDVVFPGAKQRLQERRDRAEQLKAAQHAARRRHELERRIAQEDMKHQRRLEAEMK